jgi:hypothetical protein
MKDKTFAAYYLAAILLAAAILLGICCFSSGFRRGIEQGKKQVLQTIMNAPVEGE